MRMMIVRRWAAGTALLALAAVAACGDGGGGGDGGTGPQTGTVSGQVSVGGAGMAGVTVSLSGAGTQQTNASGGYSFANVATGAREVTITLPAGHITASAADATTRPVSVAAGGTATASFALKKGVIVTASGTTFSPSAVQIDPGSTVRWVNTGGVHTVTPTTAGQPGGFASANLGAGATFEHTFAQAGTYAYICLPHEAMGMTGVVTVGNGGAPATGTVSGQVSAAAGAGMAGVTLSLAGSGTTTTDAQGNYSFASVPAGDRALTITLPNGHITASAADGPIRTVAVAGGATATANFALKRGVEVIASGVSFDPPGVTVASGGTVRWRNGGGSHTVTPSTAGQAGAWSAAGLPTGEVFEHTFTAAGVYDYHCSPHRSAGMTGSVTVQ